MWVEADRHIIPGSYCYILVYFTAILSLVGGDLLYLSYLLNLIYKCFSG